MVVNLRRGKKVHGLVSQMWSPWLPSDRSTNLGTLLGHQTKSITGLDHPVTLPYKKNHFVNKTPVGKLPPLPICLKLTSDKKARVLHTGYPSPSRKVTSRLSVGTWLLVATATPTIVSSAGASACPNTIVVSVLGRSDESLGITSSLKLVWTRRAEPEVVVRRE